MASMSTRKRFRKYSVRNIDSKHAARVGALAFTIGICGAVVTSPGVAWADDGTGSAGSTSTESNAQPASTGSDNQNTPTEPNTKPASTTEPSLSEAVTTAKRLASSLSETVTSVADKVKVIVRSSGGALTSGRGTTPTVKHDTTPDATPSAGDEELLLEEDVDGGPIAQVLNSFLPQHLTSTDVTGQQLLSLNGERRVQPIQFCRRGRCPRRCHARGPSARGGRRSRH